MPLIVAHRFAGANTNPERTERLGVATLGRAAKNVGAPRYRNVNKAGADECPNELCFQQSAGDSAGP